MTKESRPRVFQLITRLLKGGAEEHLISTVLGLKDDYDFTVGYGASYHPEQVDRLEAHGIETVRFPLLRHYNPLTAVPAIVSLTHYLQRTNFDIIHTNSTEAGIVGRFAATAAGIPHIVHTVHGIPFSDDRNRLLNQFLLVCERVAARFTDRIVTNADVIADEYTELGIGTAKQYTTIYSGIDLDRFRNASPSTDLPGSRPRVVMIGRLAQGKGFGVLLEAARTVCENEVTLCIVGDGPLADKLSRQIDEYGLSDCVYLTGYREDIPGVLAASDILVLPSFREGTPRVISEAMASGLPVVATDIAGIPEQIADGKSGYLIPTDDPEALASRLDELLSNPELRNRMGEHGYESSKEFSLQAMQEQTDNLYSALLSK